MTRAASPSFNALAGYLRETGLLAKSDGRRRCVVLALYRLVAEGGPVALAQIAAKAELDESTVGDVLGQARRR